MRTGDEQQRGFTYLLLLFVLALGAAGLAAVGERQQTLVQREREAELRFRGEAMAAAIQHYAEHTPVGQPVLPVSLDALLEDRRGPLVQRHLRRLYADPFTGQADWELVYGVAPVKADVAAEQGAAADAPVGPNTALPAAQFEPAIVARPAARKPVETADAPAGLRGIVGVRSRSTRRLFNQFWGSASTQIRDPRASDLRFIARGQSAEAMPEAPAP